MERKSHQHYENVGKGVTNNDNHDDTVASEQPTQMKNTFFVSHGVLTAVYTRPLCVCPS
jgi:hypothetical protein